MSGSLIEKMAQTWEGMEDIDPLAYELSKSLVKNDSQLIEGAANGLGWDWLAQEAQYNQDNPGEGLAKASLAAGAIMAPQGAAGLWNAAAPTAYGAATGTGAEQAAMLAAQTGEFGAFGLGKTMEAAAYAGGNGSGLMNAAGGLLAGGGGKGTSNLLMQNMGMNLMNPQQPQQPQPMAPPPRPQQIEPLNTPYGPNGNSMGLPPPMTEEEKRRLRMMGYRI
jgi:hypothetical protein